MFKLDLTWSQNSSPLPSPGTPRTRTFAAAAMNRVESPSPKAHNEAAEPFRPHDVLFETTRNAAIGTASGIFIASLHNAMIPGNVGAMAVFTRGAPIIGLSGKLTRGWLGLDGVNWRVWMVLMLVFARC